MTTGMTVRDDSDNSDDGADNGETVVTMIKTQPNDYDEGNNYYVR